MLRSLSLILTGFAVVSARPNQFFTEPDIIASHLNIEVNKPESTEPGHLFFTLEGGKDHSHFGPYIFNRDGVLIWHGVSWVHNYAVNTHVCDFRGEKGKHLCFNDVIPRKTLPEGVRDFNGHSDGVIRVFDQTYTEVIEPFGAAGKLINEPDFHEMNFVDDGESLLMDIYEPRQVDLSKHCGPQNPKEGYAYDACFQEVSTRTREVLFSWCALDHIPVHDTYLYVKCKGSKNATHAIAGHGTWLSPWDFFHMNSVDKNEEGDYMVSSRHLDTIFKIAGNNNKQGKKPGEFIWRFGGKHSDFKKEGPLANVSRQHNTRFISTGREETVISVFNNGWDGTRYIFNPVHTTTDISSGMILSINNKTKTAKMLNHFPYKPRSPKDFTLAGTQGSFQSLPGGNVYLGWGDLHRVSEYSPSGDLLFQARYTNADRSYRSYRFPWVGIPAQPPKLLVYSKTCFSPMYAYVSWNGATEVKNWRFWTSHRSKRGPWRDAGTWAKGFFETSVNFTTTQGTITAYDARYVFVEALDKDGLILSKSKVMETFVPNSTIAPKCTEMICSKLEQFRYTSEFSVSGMCPRHTERHSKLLFVLLLITLELNGWAFGKFIMFPILLKIRQQRRRRIVLSEKAWPEKSVKAG